MGKICWEFPLLGLGQESGTNMAAITMFKGAGVMDGLAREVCQNSLDARDRELGEETPVKVKFELFEIEKAKYEMFSGYEEALNNSIDYWDSDPMKTPQIESFLENVKDAISKESIPVLVMSDYNTIGLNGINAATGEKSYWNLLVNTDGISIKNDETSAGSFGIGKNAPYAYSALNLVFYNTLAKDGGRALQGVTRFVTSQREHNGKKLKTQPIGKYLYVEDEFTGRPILPEDNCELGALDVFKRNEIGTDVAIFGFRKNDYIDWEKLTAVAIIKNFILAIMDNKLEVEIKSESEYYKINKDTLKKMLFETFSDEAHLKYARQTYETVTDGKHVLTKVAEDGDLSIYVKYDDSYLASLSRFRSTGMLINTTTDVLPHYSVVIVVNDVGEMNLSKTLREAEPPQHTEWKAKNITENPTLKNRAYRYIRGITKEIQKVLDELDQADITDKMDAGIGNYIPDASDNSGSTEGTDGLKTDVKISEIALHEGRVIYNKQYESAGGNTGAETPTSGVKAGKKKHKKKEKEKIPVVTPGSGNNSGVSAGEGKVKVATVNITDHRTYYIAGNKYRCYINSPNDYDKVFIQYYAGRDDDKEDSLIVKNVKLEGIPRIDVNDAKIGPIELKKGRNTIYVEFENQEIMAVIPVFTMEVSDEN